MKRIFLFLLVLAGFAGSSHAQEKKLVQVSGIIYNADSIQAIVPYVTVINKSRNNQSFPANYQGYFSFVASEGDTIVYSAIGYRKEALVIPAGLPDMKYTVLVKMKPESITLPVVSVYPWASVDEFTRAFMTLKLADDDLLIAKKNVSAASLAALSKSLPRDGQEMNVFNFQNNHINLTNKHMNQRGANPLMNPFAWAAFIQQITQGDKSRGGN
ncbi:carboxypeptidase-like regulatory domain-containing protein [Hufsiella ginkgonis]|uniref:Carboxypeptidase-like regulatory domain-containing protein n=1 Tax=Hufsiella ginkgonis TaxID=2695274 RepID=A0A7K1XUP9_9SPHI|nr:carboxypeptidase-like regulatory domain-containing protein [Hufsiella ginkgonis]MXV14733.1 hypothetical protein [Hufsiella ginkgonis]